MGEYVNLKKKPYFLNDEQISWVENKINTMSVEEKIKQLFTILTSSRDENYLKEITSKCQFGGVRYNPGSSNDILKQNQIIQQTSAIPCLIAANAESGGNGVFSGGVEIGVGTKIGATGDLKNAYLMGEVASSEAKAVGVNTIFAPIVDVHHDFHNPIIAYKTFGSDASLVKDMSIQFLKACQNNGVIACAKHFPGDGFDERDQHLSISINPLSRTKWDQTFGKIYKGLISQGLPMIMCGHIQLPSYQRYYSPKTKEDEYLPASVCKELLTNLLKEQLDFNGVITSDATHMVGLTCSMKRKDLLPQMINAGCDMILFYNDFDEDYDFVYDAYQKGIISLDRINDAVRRILGLKAMLNFHQIPKNEIVPQEVVIPFAEHQKIASEVAKQSITLIKEEKGIFPLNPSKTPKVLIVPQHDENPFEAMMPKRKTIYEYIQEKLIQEGFQVEIFESLMDKAKKLPPPEAFKLIGNVYNNKTPVKDLKEKYDIIIHVCDFDSHNTVSRISWKMSKGTPDIPWYVHEIPTIMISLRSPFHLFDAPMVKTYINAYDKNLVTIDALIEKMMGRDTFVGKSSVDAFCGHPEIKYE